MNKANLNKQQSFTSDFNHVDTLINDHDLFIFTSMIEQIFVEVFHLDKTIIPSVKNVDFKKIKQGVSDVDVAIKIQTTQFMDVNFFFSLTTEHNITFIRLCRVITEDNQLIEKVKFKNFIGFNKRQGITCYFNNSNKYMEHFIRYYIDLRKKTYSIPDTTLCFSYVIGKNISSFNFIHTNIINDIGFQLDYKELTDNKIQRILNCHRILQLATDSPMFLELFPMVTLENIRSVNWLEPFLKEFIDSDENIDDKMKILEMISI